MKPPIPNPTKIKEMGLMVPKYSGEKNKNGTPYVLPKPSEIIEKSIIQYKSEMRLYFNIPNSNSMG
jgi:hypothetical protein